MKTLHLLRHAKSSWKDADLDDHARPLSPRGRRNAKAMGRFLCARGIEFDRVRCSTARRAVETWRRVASKLPDPVDATFDDALYLADAGELLDLVCRESDSVASLLLVGHNPGLAELALALCREDHTPELRAIATKFPTGACVKIVFDCDSWRGVRPGAGRLSMLQFPRELG